MSLCHSFLSLNVRGLRESKKRRETFRWLKRFHYGENNIIFLQETHTLAKDLLMWEKEWGSKIYLSDFSSNSRGVAILLPKNFNFVIESVYISLDGRKIILNITNEQSSYCLINIYAPTQDLEYEQLNFFTELLSDVEENIDKKIIIGGDLNLCLKPIDNSNDVLKNSKARVQINQMLETYDLIDIWHVHHPESRRYTWRRKNPITQSRLDYWIVGREMSFEVSKSDIKPSIKTDHSLITLNIAKTSLNKKGQGLWKFNSALLSDQIYVDYIKGIITLNCDFLNEVTNESLKWELIKMEIRKATISYSKTQSSLKREYEDQLNSEYNNLTERIEQEYTIEKAIQLASIKDELIQINALKTEGYRIRSKAQHIEFNEKGSKLFLNLEKRNAVLKNITRLKLENNTEVTESSSILNELSSFYENLYKASIYHDEFRDEFLSDLVPRISPEQKQFCDNEISMQECNEALEKMKLNKSPGTDGITVEFYRFFWNDIQKLVFDSIKHGFKEKTLSSEQKRGVIRLIPKKDKDLTNVKNWRPISLLNTDYKIIAHILATRLQHVLPTVISKDQSGYLKNRNISINIRSIFDIIDMIESQNSSVLLAFLDFEKAFDKINWTFLQNALKQFGFGNVLMEWVQILSTDIESCVINNGTTSKYFKIKSGVRQGCPLSALLFLVAVETMAIAIRKHENIKGVKVGNKIFKITQLADDTTLFLKDINSLKVILKMLQNFEKISGLKLNQSKTEILQIGVPLTSNYSLLKLKWEKEKIYALGSWFYKDHQKSISCTYEKRLDMLQKTINMWAQRKLTWIGRVTVIKTLCISKINYAISSVATPNWFITSADRLFQQFLWHNKPPRVKQKVIYNDYEMGGLRMTNLNHFIQAQKINWVKQLLDNKDTVPFEFLSQLINMTLEDYLKCNIDPDNMPNDLPTFYHEVFIAWFSLKLEPQTQHEIQREVLWNNRYIKIANQSLFIKKLYENGLIFINDLLENNNFLSYERVIEKYGNHITMYYYMCIKDAIPLKWRSIIKNNNLLYVNPKNETVFIKLNTKEKPVNLLKSREVYSFFNTQFIIQPSCVKTWFEKYFIEFSSAEWKKIFCLSRMITSDTKLIEFQFKIIHRVFPTDSYVSNFDNTVSKICNLCHVENNIPHMFVDCVKVNQFWQSCKLWLAGIEGNDINLSTSKIIFGIHSGSKLYINFCILHAKWFININRQENHYLNFDIFKSYLKRVLIIENQIAVNRKQLPFFNAMFRNIVNAVQ